MNLARIFVVLLAFTAGVSSQVVHQVGPGNIPEISTAITGAAPGDIIEVAPGTYSEFSVPIGVTIRATVPGTVTIDPATSTFFGQVFSVPFGQAAHVVGISMLRVYVAQGTVTFDRCLIQSPQVAMIVGNGNAHLQQCALVAQDHQELVAVPGGGLEQFDGFVTAVDTTFVGATGENLFTNIVTGRPGLWLHPNANFRGSHCTIRSGLGPARDPAVHSETNDVLISDSWLRTQNSTCPIDSVGGQFVRCTVVGACAPGTVTNGPLLTVRRLTGQTTGLQAGQPFTLDFTGEPNDFLLVFGSHGLDRTPYPELAQDFLLAASTCFPAAALMTDASGHASVTWNVISGPLPLGSQVWLQGVSGSSFPLQTSPVVGGIVGS